MGIQINSTYLQQLVEQCLPQTSEGMVADYIPELGKVNPEQLGVSIFSCDESFVEAGDAQATFTIQSIAKVISLLIALDDWGEDIVFQRVGMEPSSEMFNSITRLETNEDHKPLNPMINAGAIAVASMIKGNNSHEKFGKMLECMHWITGNDSIRLNEAVYRSEKATGDRNRSLAYFMKSTRIIETDVEEALDLYFRFSSIEVQCSDLAKIGCFFAKKMCSSNVTSDFSAEHVRIVLAIMMTSGMYNASGKFAIRVGIPAKSGVSGGIMAVVPGQMGIGVYGPAIDEKGNSVAGVKLLEQLSEDYTFSLFKG